MRSVCALDAPTLELLGSAVPRGTLSARAFDRVARVARNHRDLADTERITREHVAEALVFRGGLDRTAR